MTKYRNNLPQIRGGPFLTDGGMETTLIFHEGIELPHFASFILLTTREGHQHLKSYYKRYLAIARQHQVGFVLDTPTWRANPEWGEKLGFGPKALQAVNEDAVDLTLELRAEFESETTPVVISGQIGPRGDGYKAGWMTASEAEAYHAGQIESFAGTEADMVTAYTLTNVEEAVGIARAAKKAGMPCAISFTLETNGRLITGPTLKEAVEAVDRETGGSAAYYLVNCAHPVHFVGTFEEGGCWRDRVLGIRANASTLSHAELDVAETLDDGDPTDLGLHYRDLARTLPSLRIMGGCCGTDHRHIAAICEACLPPATTGA